MFYQQHEKTYRVKAPEGAVMSGNVAAKKGPGTLALSRSMGHVTFSQYGVSAEPDINTVDDFVGGETTAVVVASDGVWDLLSNDEVAKIVGAHIFESLPGGCCRKACRDVVMKCRV